MWGLAEYWDPYCVCGGLLIIGTRNVFGGGGLAEYWDPYCVYGGLLSIGTRTVCRGLLSIGTRTVCVVCVGAC